MLEQGAGSRVLLQQQFRHLLDIIGRDLDSTDGVLGVFTAYFPEIEVETDMRMRTARMFDIVDVERLIVRQHIGVTGAIPGLSPDKVTVLLLSEPLFPRVMYPLYHRAGRTGHLQEIRNGAAVTKRIHGPTGFRYYIEIGLQPLMT